MVDLDWSVAVCKIKPDKTRDILVNFTKFLENSIGVRSYHFLIRDRVEDDVVVCFRILLDSDGKKDVVDRIVSTLKMLIPEENFVVDPDSSHQLYEYVAWPWKERVSRDGSAKFYAFCNYLNQLSRMVVDMAEQGYFDPNERVELTRIMSWILGCAEYGQLSIESMKVGYYDRISDQYHPHLKFDLQKDQP